jgi:hypothetical protein
MSGVLVEGYTVADVAPTLVVPASSSWASGPTNALPPGMTNTMLAPTTAWVLDATGTSTWTVPSFDFAADVAPDGGLYGLCNGSPGQEDAGAGLVGTGDASFGFFGMCSGLDPNDYLPSPVYTEALRVDRDSLAFAGATPLHPPIATPVLLADDLLVGLPAPGASDAARDTSIRVYTIEGNVAVVHADSGFGVASCSGALGVALAYEPANAVGSTRVVSASVAAGAWTTHVATLPGVRPAGTSMACTLDAKRVLVATTDASPSATLRVHLVDVRSNALVLSRRDATGPFAIAPDGESAIVTETVGQSLTRVTPDGATALEGVSYGADPLLNGSVALWSLTTGYAIVHLEDGTIEPTIGPLGPSAPVVWASGGGFVVPLVAADAQNGDPQLTSLVVATPGHSASLPLPSVADNPSLVPPVGTTMFLVTSFSGAETTPDAGVDEGDDVEVPPKGPDLVAYDVGSLSLISTSAFPVCNAARTLSDGGCLP